jgi:porin
MRRDRTSRKSRWWLGLTALAGLAVASSAQAEQKAQPQSIWDQATLTGDWGGARTALKNKGIDVTLEYTNEVFGVVSGGLQQQASYEGQWHFAVNTDLEKLIGWTGGRTHVTIFQIHNSGRDVIDNAGSISDPSNIDAWSTTRLYTAWFEQDFGGLFSVRLGQIVGDGTFFTSDTAGGLINGTFGWNSLLGANLLSGGPAYPLGTPGVRVQANPGGDVTLLAAVFSGDPAGDNCNDTNRQTCDRYGTKFSFDGGVLTMAEVQYGVNQSKQAAGLPGTYKLGGWFASADYRDQHYGLNAAGAQVSLADPTVAFALTHQGNGGVYGVADQTVWRAAASSVNLFARGGVVPSDRNLVSYYVDGGVGIKGPLPGRADDTLTFGAAYAKISPAAVALERDFLAFNGSPYAVRDAETLFEVGYAAQIAPWWVVQPDLQYIWHPSGGQNPNNPTLTLDHAFIAGIRSTIKF